VIYQCQVPIGNMPVNLVLLSTGTLAFIRVATVGVIIDLNPDGSVGALFSDENFIIGGEEFEYNELYHYKEKPSMLQWLKTQNLTEPDVVFG
jgi:hypothetical protein